jgi:lipoprotein-anchoring transpeptidase ErfK/SrfK
VIEADDPANPLGEFWIGLTGIDGHAVGKESYGIHGTIEPDSIGKQASMGCIRMGADDITMVFELLVEGKSTVIVRE